MNEQQEKERFMEIISRLPSEDLSKVLDFARSLQESSDQQKKEHRKPD